MGSLTIGSVVDPVINVDGLTVRYGSSVLAVDGVSFSVRPGETVALVGANGAGKTSTINAIVGSQPASVGSVRVFGSDPRVDRANLAKRWGVMPQAGGLPMGLRVGECVELFADLYGRADDVPDVMQRCGLSEVSSRRWRTLSGGQQQRLSLAVALVGGRELLILDEPTAALDAEAQERVLQLVETASQSGAAVLVTTHRFDEVERIADRVVVLSEGRLIADQTVADLTAAHPEIRLGGLDPTIAVALSGATGLSFVERSGHLVAAIEAGRDPAEELRGVLRWCAQNGASTSSASVGSRSLADAYKELVGE